MDASTNHPPPLQLSAPFEIYLNSLYATRKNASYENECFFTTPQYICPELQTFTMTMQSISLPVTWYQIGSYNNALVITYGGALYSVTITPGNYTATQFAAFVSALATTSFSPTSPITVACSYSSIVNKFTFTRSGSGSTAWGISSSSTCLTELGYYDATPTTTTSLSFTAPNVVNLTGNNSVYVGTNYSGTNYRTTTGGTEGCIGRIPMSVQFSGILDPPHIFPETILAERQISQFVISFTDEKNRLVQITGPWQMTLKIGYQWDYTNKFFASKNRKIRSDPIPASVPAPKSLNVHRNVKAKLEPSNASGTSSLAQDGNEPTDDALVAQDTQTSSIENRLQSNLGKNVDAEHLEPQTLGPDLVEPASHDMQSRYDASLSESNDDPDSLHAFNHLHDILYANSIGPKTIHTSTVGPGPQG